MGSKILTRIFGSGTVMCALGVATIEIALSINAHSPLLFLP